MERSRSETPTAELAWRDDLTGAWNRRYLRRLLTEEWPQLAAGDGALTLLALDLDGFKPVNDTYGHAAGDRVLRWAAEELRRAFRENDRLIRYGGDEFVVVLPGVGADEARALAERVRAGFSAATIEDPAGGGTVELPISFSIGVASFPEDGAQGEALLAIADRRLYEEKRARRSSASFLGGRYRLALAAVAALAVAAVATSIALRRAQHPPEPPAALSTTSSAPAVEPAPREIVVRDEEELQALRGEVERLRLALGEESAAGERGRFEAQIRELEGRLAQAAEEAEVGRATGGGSDVEAVSGLRVGERRTRDPALEGDAVAGAGGDARVGTEPPARTTPAEAATAVNAAPVIVLPRLVRAPRIDYPPIARRLERTAVVELLLTVSPEGRVTAVEPVGPPRGLGFDDAARQAGLSAQYAPGTEDGRPIEMKTRLSIRFQL